MGASVFVIALAGLAFPIVLILAAVLVDFVVLLWVAYRWGHDSVLPAAGNYLHKHVGAPIGRYAHAHHLLPGPH
jgi:hypothetical protein